ncbi:MAG: preprotein translocase subunit SecG [Spirochaetota bacterium]|nr:preprotein translocase subunit SecG [Spirochaetota bacterium]
MDILISVITVFFMILAVLLVIIILLQSDKSAGMGILGGSSQSTFGSSTSDVITKVTSIMVGLFMVSSLGLAVLESFKLSSLEKDFTSEESKPAEFKEGIDNNEKSKDQPQNEMQSNGNK